MSNWSLNINGDDANGNQLDMESFKTAARMIGNALKNYGLNSVNATITDQTTTQQFTLGRAAFDPVVAANSAENILPPLPQSSVNPSPFLPDNSAISE